MLAKLIRSNYYVKKPAAMKRKERNQNSTQIISDIAIIKVNYFNKCLRYSRYKKDSMINKKELFEKGSERLNRDLCMFNLL